MRRRVPALAATAALALVVLTACGDDDPRVESGGAQTGQQGGGLTTDGPGRRLTVEQATKALIDSSSTPQDASWVQQPVQTKGVTSASQPPQPSIDPQACAGWFDRWNAAGDNGRVGVDESFHKNGNISDGSLIYGVRSFDEPAKASARQKLLTEAPDRCGRYTEHRKMKDGAGYDVAWTVEKSDFVRPGDSSAAIKLTAEWTNPGQQQPNKRFLQVAIVQVGHNEIFLQSYGPQEVPSSALTTMLNDGFRKLEAAAR